MEAVSNQLWKIFLFLVDPLNMAACAVIAFVLIHVASGKPYRALLLAIRFPGFKCGSGLLTKRPDYSTQKIYFFMIVLQGALSVATIYMARFNDNVG